MKTCTVEIPNTKWQMRCSSMGDWTPYEHKELENYERIEAGPPKKIGTFRSEWVSHKLYFPNQMQCLEYIIQEESKVETEVTTLANYLLALEISTEYMTSKLLPFK